MTLDDFCDQYDCTPEEREQVYYYWLSIRLRAFLEAMGMKPPARKK